MSALKDLIGALTSPAATFERLRSNPVWLGAVVILLLVAIVGTAVTVPKIDFAEITRAQIEAGGQQVTEEQMDTALAFGEKFGAIMAFAQAGLMLPLGWLLIALLMWVLIRMLGGLDLSFKQSFSTTVHAMAPWILHTLLSLPLLFARSEVSAEEIQTGGVLKHTLASFVEAEGALQQAFVSINVFSIWAVVLLGIGFSVVGQVSRAKAFGAAFGLWVLGVVVKVALASLQG